MDDFFGAFMLAILAFGALFIVVIVTGGTSDKDHNKQIKHYNRDFANFCKIDGGTPVIGDTDVCFRDNKIVWRESKS